MENWKQIFSKLVRIVEESKKRFGILGHSLEAELQAALRVLDNLKSSTCKESRPTLVMDVFAPLWDHFNLTCGTILDAMHISHELRYTPSSSLPSYRQVIKSLQLLTSVLAQIELPMSTFVNGMNQSAAVLENSSKQFASCIVTVIGALDLNLSPFNSGSLSDEMIRFVSDDSGKQIMENGLNQLHIFIQLLELATSRCLPTAFQ